MVGLRRRNRKAEDCLTNAYRFLGGYLAHRCIERFRGIVLGEEELLRPPIEGQSIFPSVPPMEFQDRRNYP